MRWGGGDVLTCHPLKHPHERCDEAIDVTGVVDTGSFQHHQCTKQRRWAGTGVLLIVCEPLEHNLNREVSSSR